MMAESATAVKPRLLCLVQLPPPVHGAAVTNQYAVESPIINDSFTLDVLPLRFAMTVGDIGRLSIGKVVRTLTTAARLGWRLLVQRPDAVYFTLSPVGGAFLRDLLLVAVMKLFCVRRIYHLRGKGIQKACDAKGWLRPLYAWAFRGAEVIHLSELLYFDIAPFVPRERLHLVANGRPDPGDASAGAVETGTPPSILFVSTMMAAKGPQVLLKAMAQLRDQGLVFQGVFAGPWLTDVFQQEWEALHAELQLGEQVRYVGPLYGDALVDAYKAADILAFPTLNECFPGVVLEAMSYGVPVVASAEGAIPEIVEDGVTGTLVPMEDAAALAAGLHALLRDRDRHGAMGQAARQRFVAHYTLPAFERRLRDALLDCVGQDVAR